MQLSVLARGVFRVITIALVVTALTACGGGGGGGSSAGSSVSLSGVAASGAAVDGILYVTGANGVEVNAPVNPDGTFSVSVQGMTAPFLLKVVPNGGGAPLYSFVSAVNSTVNVTPLTTLAVYLAADTDLETLYNAWSSNTGVLDEVSVEARQKVINANLAALFAGNSVDATFYDFMSVVFATDGSGIDGALDALDVRIDFANSSFEVAINGTPMVWNPAIDTSDINIGDFPVPAGSTWELSVIDTADNINLTEVVTGLSVPNDFSELEQVTGDEINDQFVFEGLQITVTLGGISYHVTGTGDVGTLVSGAIQGTVRVTGTANGQPVNETVQLNTRFAWQRLS